MHIHKHTSIFIFICRIRYLLCNKTPENLGTNVCYFTHSLKVRNPNMP